MAVNWMKRLFSNYFTFIISIPFITYFIISIPFTKAMPKYFLKVGRVFSQVPF